MLTVRNCCDAMRSATSINGYERKAMKRTMTSTRATRQHTLLATSEIHAALDTPPLSDTSPNITLGDVYKRLIDVLKEIVEQKRSRKALRLPDVKDLTGESRSQIYARMNPKYAAYDATWPVPFYIGKSPRWWLHDVEAWLEAQAATTGTRH